MHVERSSRLVRVGKRVSSHGKAVSFVFKPRNYISQSSPKLLQISRVTLNSLEKICQLILYHTKTKGALFYGERKETEKQVTLCAYVINKQPI